MKRPAKKKSSKPAEPTYEIIFNQLQDAVAVASQGIQLFCNSAYARLFNYPSCDHIIGCSIYDVIAPSERARVREYHERRHRGEPAPLVYETRGLRYDKSEFDLEVRISPFELNGTFYTLALLRDVTERKRTERELRSSEDQYRSALAAIHEAVLVIDRDGIMRSVNSSCERIFGLKIDQMIGHTVINPDWPAIHEDGTKVSVEELPALRCIREKRSLSNVVQGLYSPQGKLIWLSMNAEPMYRPGEPEPFASVVSVTDITERKTSERELARTLSLVQATLESTADGLLVVNAEGKIENYNKKLLDMWRLPVTVMDSKDDNKAIAFVVDQLVDPDGFVRKIGDVYSHHDEATFDILEFKDGRVFERYSQPQKVNGVYVGRVWSFRDITARVRAEKERLALERKLLETQKLESLGVLAGGIAHDFNNLLAAVLGNVSLASMQIPPDSPARTFLSSIETTTHRAAELCKQMLAYSGKGRFNVQSVNVNVLIQEMAELLRISIGKNISVTFNLTPNIPQIAADATQLRQVLMNLILNASEAIGPEKPGVIGLNSGVCYVDRTVLTDAYLAPDLTPGDYLFVEVTDSGSGMDAATKARIFDPFFTTKFTGRGLGLAAVLGIVRGHKGAIKVDSAPGHGASFRILLPCTAPTPLPPASREAQPFRLSGRVLIVEDEETLRTLQVRMLENIGMSASVAAAGPGAMKLLSENPTGFAAALIDLALPGMSGEELCRELLKLRPGLPILLTSGLEQPDVLQRCQSIGRVRFIQKPFTPAELTSALSQLLKP